MLKKFNWMNIIIYIYISLFILLNKFIIVLTLKIINHTLKIHFILSTFPIQINDDKVVTKFVNINTIKNLKPAILIHFSFRCLIYI